MRDQLENGKKTDQGVGGIIAIVDSSRLPGARVRLSVLEAGWVISLSDAGIL